MTTARRGARSVAFLGARLSGFGIQVVLAIVLANVLNPYQYGVYASGLAVSAILLCLGPLGLDQVYLSRAAPDAAIRSGLALAVAASVGLVLSASLVWPSLSSGQVWCVVLLGLSTAADHARRLWYAQPQRVQNFASRGRRELLVIILLATATLGGASLTGSAVGAAASNASLSVLVIVPALGGVRSAPWRTPWVALKHGARYAVSGALYTLHLQGPAALLVSMSSEVEVGLFRAAWIMYFASLVVPVALNNDILRPKLFLLRERPGELKNLLAGHLLATVVGSAVCVVALIAAGPAVFARLFGADFAGASPLIPWFAAAAGLNYLMSFSANVLVGLRRTGSVIWCQAVALLAGAGASIVLIPSLGAEGAVRALAAAEAVAALGTSVGAIALLARRRCEPALR